MIIRLLQVKGQRILRAGRPAYIRKESQGVLVIRATANKSLTSVLSGGLCCAHCLSSLSITHVSEYVTHSYTSCRHVSNISTESLSLNHIKRVTRSKHKVHRIQSSSHIILL
jgi:hypothetical protein